MDHKGSLDWENSLNFFSVNTTYKIARWLSFKDKKKFYDLNTAFSMGIFISLSDEFNDNWIEADMNELDNNLRKHGRLVRTININTIQGMDFYSYLFSRCPHATSITLEETNVSDVLEIIYKYYRKKVKRIDLGSPYDQMYGELSQIPYFPNLQSLKLQRVIIAYESLSELFFFVPDTVRVLSLERVTEVDEGVMHYLYSKFPKLSILEIESEIFQEGAVLALDVPLLRLKELTIGQIGTLTKDSLKLKLKSENLPLLRDFRMIGALEMGQESARLPQLLTSTYHNLQSISLTNVCLRVDYTFTNKNFPHLKSLALESCSRISPEFITHIFSRNPLLEELVLNGCKLRDEHFSQLTKKMKKGLRQPCNVKTFCFQSCGQVGLEFFKFLILHMTELVQFDFSENPVHSFVSIPEAAEYLYNIRDKTLKLNLVKLKKSFVTFDLIKTLLRVSPHLEGIETGSLGIAKDIMLYRQDQKRKISVFRDLSNNLEF